MAGRQIGGAWFLRMGTQGPHGYIGERRIASFEEKTQERQCNSWSSMTPPLPCFCRNITVGPLERVAVAASAAVGNQPRGAAATGLVSPFDFLSTRSQEVHKAGAAMSKSAHYTTGKAVDTGRD